MYLLVDLMGDYKATKTYKELKELLLEELNEDIFGNITEREIVLEDVKILTKIAKEELSEKNIREELENYGWKTIDLMPLERDLEDLKMYFLDKKEYVGNICETIDLINKEINKES